MKSSTAKTSRWSSRSRNTRVVAVVCGLLLLLPVLSVRSLVAQQRASLRFTEESRQGTEEERASEDLLEWRCGSRRHQDEARRKSALAAHRGGRQGCHSPGHSSSLAAEARAEHRLRNGIGGPLRC